MKKFLLTAFTIVLAAMSIFAQSEKYTSAMKKNIAGIDAGFKNPAEFLTLANSFERIATTEKTQWLPYYYGAYCLAINGLMEQDKTKVDALADKASALIASADSLSPNNSEISCIKSMIASCHMMVDPMQRWQQYGAASSDNMEAAMKQDPANPRPYFLKGQSLKYTPEQFGGGCATAKPQFTTAMEKFEVFKPTTELSPSWGKEATQRMLTECK